jgi:myo-inositol-1(or 4)-monophosphatase
MMALHPRDAARLAADCIEIAERGAAVALRGFRSHPIAREKSVHDVVTEYDTATQASIVELICERHPGVPVVAEEGQEDPPPPPPSGLSFAVDPIDGTTNFAHGHPFWCVSVGVLLDGEPVAGGVLAPALATRWSGWHVDGEGLATRNGEPCRVSETTELGSALLATGFPPVRDVAPDNNFDSFMRVKKLARGVRRCGAAALDLAFVADGTYDGYWERRLHLWDAAASAAMVLAAGGRITTLQGNIPAYERGHIIATNGLVHDALMAAIG